MSVLPVVIALPEAAIPGKVEKLVAYCKALDGTECRVLPISKAMDAEFLATRKSNAFFQLQAWTLRLEAESMKSQPFIHLEVDSIPIAAGWAQMISDEYARLKKPYLWAWDQNAPADLCGGIGVYGPDTAREIPCEIDRGGWDGWMLDNISGKIARTPLIQHKYGHYDGYHKTRDVQFPRDNQILRRETVLFHRDVNQSLMRKGEYRYSHSGCLGDTVAALKTIQIMGGGHLVMTNKNNPRELRGPRYEFLKPLLEAQPYLKSVTWEEDPQNIDVDFTDFRTTYEPHHSLAWTQARYVGLDLTSVEPWLFCAPNPATAGKIVIHRSARYQNSHFPWKLIAQEFRDRLIFVGLPEEKAALEAVIGGIRLQHLHCKDALEMAQAIKGADRYIGNQSSPFWIACGVGAPLVQETWNEKPDSIIARPGCFYFRQPSDVEGMPSFLQKSSE